MNDYTRRRRIATVVAAVALIVMLVLVGLLALQFETREERPGAATATATLALVDDAPI